MLWSHTNSALPIPPVWIRGTLSDLLPWYKQFWWNRTSFRCYILIYFLLFITRIEFWQAWIIGLILKVHSGFLKLNNTPYVYMYSFMRVSDYHNLLKLNFPQCVWILRLENNLKLECSCCFLLKWKNRI